MHQAERLAVALGIRAAEIALEIALGVPALLRADQHDALVAEGSESADDRPVVGVDPVAVQFDEIRDHFADVVHRVGAERMARNLDLLPRRQILVNLPARFADLFLHPIDLERDVDVLRLAERLKLLQLLFQLDDRFLERQCIGRHGLVSLKFIP